MSSKLTKALEFANYRTTLNVQHNALKAKVQTLLSFSLNGGTFEISQELISFVQTINGHRGMSMQYCWMCITIQFEIVEDLDEFLRRDSIKVL